ncbi:hypothetical protein CHUAL_012411 [Chamberlinius hualienensis]
MAVTSQSEAKSQNTNAKGLTFTKAIKYLLYLHLFFGINVSRSVKWQTMIDNLFAIHLLMSVMYIAFASVKADFGSDDNEIVFLSVAYIILGMSNLLMKLSHRRQCHNKTKLIKEIERVLKRFNGKEAVQMEMLEKWSPRLVVVPMLIVAVHLIYTTEKIVLGDNHVDFGTKTFQDLSEKYYIDYIYNYTMAPFNFAYELLITLMLIPVISTLKFVVDQLISLEPTYANVVKFVQIHRDICRLYRLTNTAFSTNVLFGVTSLLIFTLAFARTVTVNWQAISWATVTGVIVFLTVLFAHIIFISIVNETLRQSNCHLLQMGSYLSRKRTRNLVSDKLDLYVTEVNLDFPYLTVGNWIKAEKHLVVVVCIIAIK